VDDAVIYAFGMIPLTRMGRNFSINDFWRWWVVHLRVEWSFELFSAAVTGYFLMAIGLVSRQLFGAFGLLSIGLIYLALRYMAGNRFEWRSERRRPFPSVAMPRNAGETHLPPAGCDVAMPASLMLTGSAMASRLPELRDRRQIGNDQEERPCSSEKS
jgi:hypothetical protein